MLSRDLCTWSSKPDDFILEGMWYITIEDDYINNSFPWFNDQEFEIFDLYVKDVSIPLNSISYDKTNFGKVIIKERNLPSSVSISFVDSIKNPWLNKFNTWLSQIYDFEKNCVKKRWRKEGKTVKLSQINIKQRKNMVKLFSNNVGGSVAIAKGISSLIHIDMSDVFVQLVATHELENCFISKIDDLSFNSEGSDPKEFSIELECEKTKSTYYTGGMNFLL